MAKISLSYPDTWLIISISVKNRDTWTEDFSGTMTEVGITREYKYDFTEVANTDYVYVATATGYSNMSGVIYRDGGGLTTDESTHLLQLVNSTGGGWFSINYQAINSHTTNKVNELKEQIEKIPNLTEKLIEIQSQNDIAINTIIDTIKESENDICSDVIRKTKELKEDNITTRNLIRQKTDKVDKNVSKLSDRQDLTDRLIEDQAEEIEEELERIYEQEVDMIENEINTQFEKEAQEIENEINQ